MKRLALRKRPEVYAINGFLWSKSDLEILIIQKRLEPPIEKYLVPTKRKRKVCGKTWEEVE